MPFSYKKEEFDWCFNRLDRPVEEFRPDRPVDPTGAGRPNRFPSLTRYTYYSLKCLWLPYHFEFNRILK